MILALLGPTLICIGLMILVSISSKRLRCTNAVDGKIVDIFTKQEAIFRGGFETYYYPVYEYQVEGRTYHSSSTQCSKLENWFQIGDTSTIYYNQHNPEEIVSKRFGGDFIASAAFTIAGIILLVIYKFH